MDYYGRIIFFFFFQSDLLIHFNLFIDVVRKKKKETLHIGIYDPLLSVMRLLSVLLTVFIQSFKVYEEPFRNIYSLQPLYNTYP